MIEVDKIPSPCYVMEEELLRSNLSLIKHVKEAAGVNIILAFKAFALWKSFPIIKEYISCSTASSVFEAQLAYEEMGNPAHTFSPGYTADNFPVFMKYSSHITFNSLSQLQRFYPMVAESGKKISCGLRINPEFSEVETDLYNPCAPGSRFGVIADQLGDILPEGVEGLHFHTLCESTSYNLEKTLTAVEERFGHLLKQAKWLNMGGGHLMTRSDYEVNHLISLLKGFRQRYPNLEVIMEPGSAFVWQTGTLVSTVIDIVENRSIKTAIVDVSFACHMPDCLEMPYKPRIRGAYQEPVCNKPTYRIGGNSCLSGDFVGEWSFDEPLLIGDKIIFEDMIHYTTVKTTMFNGISHPAIALWTKENKLEIYRKFGYEDYKNRMC
ncbi:carboxynorspermidine decarboxylase [Dysgonomonas sp. PH5-45]|uniref:carboxynorspermidine decarboxylase n=1 Tax=unclassified Dysgonomonas TaxID=2630389 RepID=UPI0024745A3C|nr:MULTISPECIES: carboxynorspermidine decarboxylase [unclassified Dysgonomonas]MDH6355335.1 carboxynorspermidine decarboxylase [Dysgonomonas sp. PH5-45]MDH6388233.1 carboxynorspermidine decarboxylase [Dysgonomonas sp. PH5-37]